MIKKYPHLVKLFTRIDPKNGEAWALDSIQKYNSYKGNIFNAKFRLSQHTAWALFAETINKLYKERHDHKNRTRPGPR